MLILRESARGLPLSPGAERQQFARLSRHETEGATQKDPKYPLT